MGGPSGADGASAGQSGGGKGGSGGEAAGGKGGAGGSAAGGQAGAGGGGGNSAGGSTSSGCGKDPMLQSNQYDNGSTIWIAAANMQRRYILSVPKNYDKTKPYRLIIAYHQLDGNDKQMYQNGYYHLQNLANDTTIFVAPNGQKNNAPCSGIGSGESGCGWPNGNNSDIALADAVVAQLEENFCIDKNRIFATGWSYGASNLMGCTMGYPLEFCSFNGDQTPDPDNGQSGNSWQCQVVWTFLSHF